MIVSGVTRSSSSPASCSFEELVIRLVPVERVDHVIAVTPDVRLGPVALEAVGLGVAHQVEPVAGPALAVAGRRQQPIDHLLEPVRRFVGQQRVNFLGRGRQADQIVMDPPQQRQPVRGRHRPQPRRFQLGQHEGIDRIAHPSRNPSPAACEGRATGRNDQKLRAWASTFGGPWALSGPSLPHGTPCITQRASTSSCAGGSFLLGILILRWVWLIAWSSRLSAGLSRSTAGPLLPPSSSKFAAGQVEPALDLLLAAMTGDTMRLEDWPDLLVEKPRLVPVPAVSARPATKRNPKTTRTNSLR